MLYLKNKLYQCTGKTKRVTDTKLATIRDLKVKCKNHRKWNPSQKQKEKITQWERLGKKLKEKGVAGISKSRVAHTYTPKQRQKQNVKTTTITNQLVKFTWFILQPRFFTPNLEIIKFAMRLHWNLLSKTFVDIKKWDKTFQEKLSLKVLENLFKN